MKRFPTDCTRRPTSRIWRGGGIIDYKIHCLNGTPRFILATSNRVAGPKENQYKANLFDMDWDPIYEVVNCETESDIAGKLPRPDKFEQMCAAAKDLSSEFKFVRVDLYELKGHVYFGELTFSPACCVFPHYSDKFNLEMGRYLKI